MLLTLALTVGTAVSLTTAVVATAVQPFALVTVTEYGPAALTLMLAAVELKPAGPLQA